MPRLYRMELSFEWDPEKARANLRKHGVSFEEAATVFSDPLARLLPDREHSEREERYVLFGRADPGRLLAVMHTERGDMVRIISARRMTPKERRQYEQFRG